MTEVDRDPEYEPVMGPPRAVRREFGAALDAYDAELRAALQKQVARMGSSASGDITHKSQVTTPSADAITSGETIRE